MDDELSDSELMELVKAGDFSAFDKLYNRYSKQVYRFVYSLTWSSETSQDYVQEVFYRLYKSRQGYKPSGRFVAFLYRIAKNLYLSERRKASNQNAEVSLSFQDETGRNPFENLRANQKIEPEVHLLEEYRRWKIRQAIGSLPEHQRLVFIMSNLQGMNYSEISEALQVPIGTVKSRMFCAVKALRVMLKEEQNEL